MDGEACLAHAWIGEAHGLVAPRAGIVPATADQCLICPSVWACHPPAAGPAMNVRGRMQRAALLAYWVPTPSFLLAQSSWRKPFAEQSRPLSHLRIWSTCWRSRGRRRAGKGAQVL